MTADFVAVSAVEIFIRLNMVLTFREFSRFITISLVQCLTVLNIIVLNCKYKVKYNEN